MFQKYAGESDGKRTSFLTYSETGEYTSALIVFFGLLTRAMYHVSNIVGATRLSHS